MISITGYFENSFKPVNRTNYEWPKNVLSIHQVMLYVRKRESCIIMGACIQKSKIFWGVHSSTLLVLCIL